MLLVNTGQNEAKITGLLLYSECHYLIVKYRVENNGLFINMQRKIYTLCSNVSLTA